MKDKQSIEEAKKRAALEAVKQVTDGSVIGLGSGSTTAYAIEEIGRRIEREEISVLAVPSSYQALTLAVNHQIPLTTLAEHPTIDLTIDGADQIDNELNLIKGMGGALTREKIVASASKRLIIIADSRKKVNIIGENNQPVPVEVLPFAAPVLAPRIIEIGGTPKTRESLEKVGPVITDNCNWIIDVIFGPIREPAELEHKLKSIPGVIETGLFVRMTEQAYIGYESNVKRLSAQLHANSPP